MGVPAEIVPVRRLTKEMEFDGPGALGVGNFVICYPGIY